MRWGVAALLVFALGAALAWSCGGGGSTSADQPDASAKTPPPPPPGDDGDAGDAGAGAACSADAGPPKSAPAWLSDDSLWAPVPGLESCNVYQGKLPSTKLPTRVYCDCGDGCSVTAGNLEGTGGVGVGRGWYDDAATYIHMTSSFGVYDVREIVDITHRKTLTALETRNAKNGDYRQCDDDTRSPLGPWFVESWFFDGSPDPNTDNGPFSMLYARSRYRETTELEPLHIWQNTPLYDEGSPATDGVEIGYLDLHGSNALHASTDWDAGFPLPVAAPTDGQGTFANLTTWGSTLAWHGDALAQGNLYVWSTAGGSKTIAHRTAHIMTSAIGSDGFVWIEAATTSMSDGGDIVFSDLQLWWIPDLTAATPTPARVATGLLYTSTPSLVTGGGYAAFVSCADPSPVGARKPSDCPLSIVKLSTGKLWTLAEPSATTFWTNAFVVNARELVAGEDAYPGNASQQSYGRRVFILDMTKLDALVTRFAAQ